jgi:hypothetical protein
MKLRLIAIFCIALTLFIVQPALAQITNNSDQAWAALRQLPIGENLRVETKDGKNLAGTLSNMSDTELQLERKGKTASFRRAELQKIWQVSPPNPTKQKIFSSLGVGAGFIAGLAIAINLGFKQCGGSCADEKVGGMAAIIGLPVGGGLLGKALAGKGKHTLVYSAP